MQPTFCYFLKILAVCWKNLTSCPNSYQPNTTLLIVISLTFLWDCNKKNGYDTIFYINNTSYHFRSSLIISFILVCKGLSLFAFLNICDGLWPRLIHVCSFWATAEIHLKNMLLPKYYQSSDRGKSYAGHLRKLHLLRFSGILPSSSRYDIKCLLHSSELSRYGTFMSEVSGPETSFSGLRDNF